MNPNEIEAVIPEEHKAAFKKALGWNPRLKGWGFPINKTMQSVKSGKKPLAYGFREDVMRDNAEKFGLETDGVTAFLPENSDIAALIKWVDSGSSGLTSDQEDWVKGIALGYPIVDVDAYVEKSNLEKIATRIASSKGFSFMSSMDLWKIATRIATGRTAMTDEEFEVFSLAMQELADQYVLQNPVSDPLHWEEYVAEFFRSAPRLTQEAFEEYLSEYESR